MTVGCRVRVRLSIKQLIATPPITPSASSGRAASPQVCSSKRPTANSSHIIAVFVCMFLFWTLGLLLSVYHAFAENVSS